MFHNRKAFDHVAREMRRHPRPAGGGRPPAVSELIGRLEALFASRANTPPPPLPPDA